MSQSLLAKEGFCISIKRDIFLSKVILFKIEKNHNERRYFERKPQPLIMDSSIDIRKIFEGVVVIPHTRG
ncbi:MAG: hypothetical protein COV66_10200 [Nitrospinae bacterium CG11_big_fil_rev_8_21_14_0_20_45_15]|nr:MAG: hypothetical protein COV66_10200 [Nitrospinae bacterium CG11_big_fil_rev_8_21_14_0_20_45_15]